MTANACCECSGMAEGHRIGVLVVLLALVTFARLNALATLVISSLVMGLFLEALVLLPRQNVFEFGHSRLTTARLCRGRFILHLHTTSTSSWDGDQLPWSVQ